MSRRPALILAAAAIFTSSALFVPTTGLAAQNWTSIINNGQPMVQGSGHIVRQSRRVGAFSRVETIGSESVEVRFGAQPSLVIAADDNILPLITSEVRNGTLKLGSRGSFRIRSPIKVWITTPNLQAYTTSGSGDVAIHQLNNSRLGLTINGSSDVVATGRTGNLDLAIRGSGSARLSGLAAGDVKAKLYGSGDAKVRASGRLDANVFGSGTLRYIGHPQHLSQRTFGSGKIVAAR